MTEIWLGDDVADRREAREELGHGAVFGLTRKSGKTTTLRTVLHRATSDLGADAIVFRTGGEEIPFPGAERLTPFFRERLDWHSVETMLWTFLSEKNRTYRPLVMKAVHGAKTLEQVHRNAIALGEKSSNGWVKDRTYELDQYFQEIIPWVRGHRLDAELHEPHGFGVVDLEGWPQTVQQLVVAATLDAVLESHVKRRVRPLFLVLPEARAFIPSDRVTPVTRVADLLTTQGAKRSLFLWIDSQALTGVNQQILRNFALVLQGVQTSDLEITRICKALDGVKPAMVRRLKVGDFIVSTPRGVRTIHVPLVEPKEDPKVDEKERRGYGDQIEELTRKVATLEEQLRAAMGRAEREHERAEANARAAAANAVEKIRRAPSPDQVHAGPEDSGVIPSSVSSRSKADVHIFTETPDLTIHVAVVRRDAGGDEPSGRAALLVATGFFDERKSVNEACSEFRARGWGEWKGGSGWNNMDRMLNKLASEGFLRSVDKGYVVVPEAKRRIRVKEEAAA